MHTRRHQRCRGPRRHHHDAAPHTGRTDGACATAAGIGHVDRDKQKGPPRFVVTATDVVWINEIGARS